MKKIFDILPPNKIKELIKQPFSEKFSQKKDAKKNLSVNRQGNLFFKKLIIFGSIFCLAIFFTITYFYSSLVVYLNPKMENLIFKTEAEVNISQLFLDLENKVIPGTLFEAEEAKQGKYISTGKDFIEKRAQGMIRVYNSHNPPTPISLVVNTRFLSAEKGKVFLATEKIYLPPAKKEKGKIAPSFKDVAALAQEGGEDYNINPSKFSVPGFTGTPFYYTVWAESFAPIEGGLKKEVKVISEQDLEKAKEQLKKEIEDLVRNSLKKQLPEDFVLAKGGDFIKDSQVFCLEKAGEQKPEFSCQGKIKMAGLGFKHFDLKNLALDFIQANILSSKKFDIQNLLLEYFSQELFNDEGKIKLNLKIEIPVYDEISEKIMASEIKGKTETEIKEYILGTYPQVEKIEFKFWPFWIKKAPESLEKIRVEIR
ncbi:hypothetical protein COY61_01315 [bacterium (Candidatus Gribaldobacteria) CG_4_10_14_0_8_um_filter_33_9]|uniref:Baseplate protein J-like domain-containing protein n=1 Tax=bacterium (Candidatus Gribaldobacteria) CG_4_10_14_0_8_um_filter_33_9 TaxID=2014266 RepID=A0A2M7RN47_9BACT|nr:MAG: hypothetical protein COY61_01315 [bacterium (Candidatus Gribaldobacteria) CG_4_10_14_0_8_um_filter_33_9]